MGEWKELALRNDPGANLASATDSPCDLLKLLPFRFLI